MVYKFGPFLLDLRKGFLRKDGDIVNMPPKVFSTLCHLVEHRGDVVSKASLMAAVWPEAFVGENSLSQTIFLLRKSLGRAEDGKEYIETLSKRGYRIAVEVEIVSEPAAEPPIPGPELTAPPIMEALLVSEPTATPQSFVPSAKGRTWILWTCAVSVILLGVTVVFQRGLTYWRKPEVVRFTRLTNDGLYKERLISLLSDGSRLYFTENVDAASYLAEVSTEGGETLRRAAPSPTASALSYSPIRHEMLFGSLWEQHSDTPLVAMSLPGGTLHPLAHLGGHGASWSPDGKRVVVARDRSLFIADADGARVHEIARMPETPHWLRWSPDGSRIRFSLRPSGQNATLWEVSTDGTGLHPLFKSEPWAQQACCGDWTPDGRYYVFVVEEARKSSLWISPETRFWLQPGSPSRLAEGPVDFWRAPVVSADGSHIYALGEQARGELVKFNPKTQHFEPYLDGISTDTISFSRDGKWMAYTLYPEGTLWRSRVDGSDRLRLTDPPGVARFPQWSPDGKQLIYMMAGKDNLRRLYKVAAGGGRSDVLVNDNTNQGVGTWSADGSKIAFGQLVAFGVDNQRQPIRILDIASGRISVLPHSNGLWTARWSPDGRSISAVTTDNRKLMLYDFDGDRWTELTDQGVNDVVWSRDSDSIFFDSTTDANVYRVDMKTREVKPYGSLQGMRRTGFDGWSVNMAPDGEPLLLREAGINEVYALQVHLP